MNRIEFIHQSNKIYPSKFKIESIQKEIEDNVLDNQITFISSPTGSGKSTQIPLYLYNLHYQVICSEPRKVACETVYDFFKENHSEIKVDYWESSYYNGNFDILLIRENALLNYLMKDCFLSKCNALIIDEIHERTMTIDLILYYLKYFILPNRQDFKLIITSATFDIDNISEYFEGIKFGIVKQNFMPNYTIEYRDIMNRRCWNKKVINESNNDEGNKEAFTNNQIKFIIKEIAKIIRDEVYQNYNQQQKKSLTILVFLPDYKSIYFTNRILTTEFRNDTKVKIIEFFGSMKYDEQINRVNSYFDSSQTQMHIILSTNLAETCLTFCHCEIVIDTGLRKYNKFNYQTNLFQEFIDYISQDSATQRAGRCGREEGQKGKCYRLYSEETYTNKMSKYRIPEVELMNINTIILKLFAGQINSKFILDLIDKLGYLDFVSKIDKDVIFKIIDILVLNNTLIELPNGELRPTDFGCWLCKAQLEIFLGKIIYELNTKNILNKNIVQTLCLISQNQSCELFYSNINPNNFKYKYIDYNKINEKEKTDLSPENFGGVIKNIPDVYKPAPVQDGEYLPLHIKLYHQFRLFKTLDQFYNANNYFSENKVFQLGDLMIYLFFLNQYNQMKCSNCRFTHKEQRRLNKKCIKCNVIKLKYCQIYSLNEKFFSIQKNTQNHILRHLDSSINKTKFLHIKSEEKTLAEWNIVYIKLLSNKCLQYLTQKKIEDLLQKVQSFDINKIRNEIYERYKDFYIDFGKKVLGCIKENVFYKKVINNNDEEFKLYYNLSTSKYERIKMPKNYFFCFFVDQSNKFFSLVKYSKLSNTETVYYKNINPILDDMVTDNQQYFNTNIEKSLNNIEYHVVENVGKYFYYNFLKNKFVSQLTAYNQNKIFFIFPKGINTKEKEKLNACIDQERKNIENITEDFHCLKNDCMILKVKQGFDVFDVTSEKNDKIYEIASYLESEEISMDDIESICISKQVKYKKIFEWKNKILISFENQSHSVFFLKVMHQYLNIIIRPFDDKGKNYDLQREYNLFSVSFNKEKSNEEIKHTMYSYLKSFNLGKPSVFIQTNRNTKDAYYYVPKGKMPTFLYGDIINKARIFQIKPKLYYSYIDFFVEFADYCNSQGIEIEPIKFKKRSNFFKIIGVPSLEKLEIVNQYLSETEIQLNQFAFLEIKMKTKDSFLYDENYTYKDLKDYVKYFKCNIDIVYFDKKVIIYGAPKFRSIIKKIITDYYEKLNKEKISLILTSEQMLLLRYLLKSSQMNSIAILCQDISQRQIEFRRQYLNFVKRILKTASLTNNSVINRELFTNLQCEICLESLNSLNNEINSSIQLRFCGHCFCVDCLKMQVINQSLQSSNFPLKCVKCNNIIANSDIKEIFNTQEIEKFSYNLMKIFFMAKKNSKKFLWCKNPDCKYIYSKSSFNLNEQTFRICPNCDRKFCLLCEEEMKNHEHNRNCEKDLLEKVDIETRKWMMENTRNCPICFHQYEKMEGCNHMTCNFCRPPTHFCYLCGKKLDNNNPLRHFSSIESTCYNKLYSQEKPMMLTVDERDEMEGEEDGKEKNPEEKEKSEHVEEEIEDDKGENLLDITKQMVLIANVNQKENGKEEANEYMAKYEENLWNDELEEYFAPKRNISEKNEKKGQKEKKEIKHRKRMKNPNKFKKSNKNTIENEKEKVNLIQKENTTNDKVISEKKLKKDIKEEEKKKNSNEFDSIEEEYFGTSLSKYTPNSSHHKKSESDDIDDKALDEYFC